MPSQGSNATKDEAAMPGCVCKRRYWSEPKGHTEKDARKKVHTTQKKTQKKTQSSQRAAAAGKLVPVYMSDGTIVID